MADFPPPPNPQSSPEPSDPTGFVAPQQPPTPEGAPAAPSQPIYPANPYPPMARAPQQPTSQPPWSPAVSALTNYSLVDVAGEIAAKRMRRRPGGVFWLVAGLVLLPTIACAVLGVGVVTQQPQLLAGVPLLSAHVSGVVYGEDAAQIEAGRVALSPLVGATVNCGAVSATTDASGAYSLSLSRFGSVSCWVSAAQYATTTISVHPNSGDYTLNFGAPHATTAGGRCVQAASGLNCGALTLQPGSIDGVAIDSQSLKPVSSAQVFCWNTSLATTGTDNAQRLTAESDQYGHFALANVAVGPYACTAGVYSTAQSVVVRPNATSTLNVPSCLTQCPGVLFHNGHVLHSVTMYFIYWLPSGEHLSPSTSDARSESLYTRFINDLGGSSFYHLLSQYWDFNGPVGVSIHIGGTYTDTHAYPHRGTQADPLFDSDLTNEIIKDYAATGWKLDQPGSIVAVLTGYGIEQCSGTYYANSCTYSNNDSGMCAYHSYTFLKSTGIDGAAINVPYMDIPNVPQCDIAWSLGEEPQPNGAPQVDVGINLLSHELFESVSDPFMDGWYGNTVQVSETEIGDLCAYHFGPLASDGSTIHINGHGYDLQEEWSQARGVCSYA